MTISRNIDRTTGAFGEMVEAQGRAYEALADNLAAFQRRSGEAARNGARFIELQERNAGAAQEWWASSLKVLRLQQRNAEFAQNWMSSSAEALRGQAEDNARTAREFARSVRAYQECMRTVAEGWAGPWNTMGLMR